MKTKQMEVNFNNFFKDTSSIYLFFSIQRLSYNMLRLEVFINADPLVCAFTLDLIGKTTFSICQHIFLKTQHIQNLIPFIRSSQSSLPLLILLEFFIFFQQLSQENSKKWQAH